MLVTVGTDHHPFTRLIGWLDTWLADGADHRVRRLIQYGAADAPAAEGGVASLDYDDLQRALGAADIVICHAGAATIMEARRYGRLPVIVPREPDLGEIVDGHQVRFARRIAAEGIAVNCETEQALREVLDEALADPGRLRIPAGDHAAVAEPVRRAGELIDVLLDGRARRAAGAVPAAAAPVGDPADWPSVGVVIATRDRPELLRAALASIRAQDYPGRLTCTLVYDQSEPDGTLADGDAVTVTTNTRTPGLPGARNSGILRTETDLVAFCDDDDVWLPGKLRAQVSALLAAPDSDLACCGIEVDYDGTRVPRMLATDRVHLTDLLRSRLTELHPSTFVIRRAALTGGLGLVSEQIPGGYGEDYELLLRAARRGPIVNVPTAGARVLWHRQSYFTQRWETIATALPWLLEHFPEFRLQPAGYARITGQIAFASAAKKDRAEAVRWARRTVAARLREPRAYLAVAVAAGLVRPDSLMRILHRRGRGI